MHGILPLLDLQQGLDGRLGGIHLIAVHAQQGAGQLAEQGRKSNAGDRAEDGAERLPVPTAEDNELHDRHIGAHAENGRQRRPAAEEQRDEDGENAHDRQAEAEQRLFHIFLVVGGIDRIELLA